eukprot:SAG22_NODE_1896_length_3362_cov_3.255899_2_plen_126_part_00
MPQIHWSKDLPEVLKAIRDEQERRAQTELETMIEDNLREIKEHVARKEAALTTQSDESSEESDDEASVGFHRCPSLPLEDASGTNAAVVAESVCWSSDIRKVSYRRVSAGIPTDHPRWHRTAHRC